MRKILVPFDFSTGSHKALEIAGSIAHRTHSTITVLHVITSTSKVVNTLFKEEIRENLEKGDFEKILTNIAHDYLGKTYPGIKVGWKLEYEARSIYRCISDEVEDHDMVIMGTKGANDLRKKIIGSNTSAVMNMVSKPVLAIPQNFQFDGNLDHILYIDDYNDFDHTRYTSISHLFQGAYVKLDCLDINLGHNPYITKNAEILKEQNPQSTFHVLDSTEEIQSILAFTSEHPEYDILSLPTPRRSWIERIMDRSYTEDLIHHTDLGILAI